MGHIFISYSHKDKKYVEKLEQKLREEGFSVWIDHNIDYGDEWLKVIQNYLDGCDVFIVVMSKNSFESDMVQNEVTRAREKNKPIFPILFGDENWLIFQAKQYVDASDGSLPPEKFYKRLEKVISRKKIEKTNHLAPATKPEPKQKKEKPLEPELRKKNFTPSMTIIVITTILTVCILCYLFYLYGDQILLPY